MKKNLFIGSLFFATTLLLGQINERFNFIYSSDKNDKVIIALDKISDDYKIEFWHDGETVVLNKAELLAAVSDPTKKPIVMCLQKCKCNTKK